jgi:predicted acylesterase/phospholipase RssA
MTQNDSQSGQAPGDTGKKKRRIGLVLSGYAPAMTLASGAMLGFMEKGIEFDVISTSGSGALVALLFLAPAGNDPKRALEELPNLYMSDLTHAMAPLNLRLGTKNSPFAKRMYELGKLLPRFDIAPGDPAVMQRLFNDWMDWAVNAMTPTFEYSASGLLSHSPRLREMIDFRKLRDASPRFYMSAFDLAAKKVEIFDKNTTDYDAFCASQSTSLFYPPHRVLSGDHCSGNLFISAISHDATGLQAIWLNEVSKPGKPSTLDMVLALDPIANAVWREPTGIVDAFHLMLANPIAALKQVTLGLYAGIDQTLEEMKSRKLPRLYRIPIELDKPYYPRTEILKWTHSNAVALQKIGRRAATEFADVLLSGDKKKLEEHRFWHVAANNSGWDVLDMLRDAVVELKAKPTKMRRDAKGTDAKRMDARGTDARGTDARGTDANWWSRESGLGVLIGGGAPNVHLSAGALCAFYEKEISFDAVSASGAGSLPGLLYAAPAKANSQADALKALVNLNIADEIERLIPMNFKVFFKSGPFTEPAWRLGQALPRFPIHAEERYTNHLYRLYNDTLDLLITMMTPTTLNPFSTGMCTRVGMLHDVIDWKGLKSYPKQFYLNAFDLETQRMDTFGKDDLDEKRYWAALAMPWLFAPAKIGDKTYTEGASHDPSGLGTLLRRHLGASAPGKPLKAIYALETVGSELWANPETLYDAIQITIMEPIVSLAEIIQATYGFFEFIVNRDKKEPVVPKLYRVPFPVPDWQTDNILRWNYSNALTLWHAGHSATRDFIKERDEAERNRELIKKRNKAKLKREFDEKRDGPELNPDKALEGFESKYRYYLSVQEKPRVKDMLNVFEDIFKHYVGGKEPQ